MQQLVNEIKRLMSENESVKFLALRKIVYDTHAQTDVARSSRVPAYVCMYVRAYQCIESTQRTEDENLF